MFCVCERPSWKPRIAGRFHFRVKLTTSSGQRMTHLGYVLTENSLETRCCIASKRRVYGRAIAAPPRSCKLEAKAVCNVLDGKAHAITKNRSSQELAGCQRPERELTIGQTLDVVDVGRRAYARAAPLDDYFSIFAATVDAVSSPLYIVYGDGRLLFANSAARSCLRQGRWLESQAGRINASSHHDCAPALYSALERLRCGNGSTVLMTHKLSGRQAVVTVAPISLPNKEIDSTTRLGLIWLTTSDPDVAPLRQVARLFKITPAEQQLLSELISGASLREASRRLNVSIHTVRNQLKSVLGKTRRHSQAQLLTLVTRMASLRLPDQD